MIRFLLFVALATTCAADVMDDLGTDAELGNDISVALGMVNENADGSFSLDHEDHLTALLETDALEQNHMEAAMQTQATIEAAVSHAIHETMVEHDMHTSQAKVKGFFAELFNCNKCKLNSGNSGMTVMKMIGRDQEKTDAKRRAALEKVFGKNDKQVSKAEFTQALIAIRTAALATSNKYDEEGEGKKSPFVISVDSYKWWKRVKPVDFDTIFDSITLDQMDYANDLQDECEELDITDDITRGHISPANVNAEKCDKLKHCTAMLTTSVLTDQNKLICMPSVHIIEEMREAKAKLKRAAVGNDLSKLTIDAESAVKAMINEMNSGEMDLAEKAADMEIEAANALEWQVAGPAGFDPLPNLMRSYVCTPLDPSKFGLSSTVYGGRRNKKQATTENDDSAGPEGATAAAATAAAATEGEVHAIDDEETPQEEKNMLTKVVNKVKSFLGKAFVKVKEVLRALWRVMYTSMRCGVCVICNLVDELSAFFVKIGKRMKVLMKAMKEGIKKTAGELMSTAKSLKLAIMGGGRVKEGDAKLKENMICGVDSDCEIRTHYCGRRQALVQKRCRKKNNIPAGACCWDKDDKETLEVNKQGDMVSKVGRDCELGLFCVNVGSGIVGCANKCMAENTAPKKKKKFWQRKLLTQVVIQNRKLGVKRATKLRKKVRRLQRMHRVVSEIVKKQAAGQLSRNHLETELMTKHAAKMMISKTVAMMHAHAADGKKEQVRRAATTMGGPLASLPNSCISEVNLGSGMGIMINVENPNLVKMLAQVAKNFAGIFTLPIPDILIGITPTTFANTVSDPACMASVAARSANHGKGVPARTLSDAVDNENTNDAAREFF